MKTSDPLHPVSIGNTWNGPNMRGDLPYYRFANMADLPGFVHGIFTRQGGVSKAPFDALNVGLGLGDLPDAVSVNRRRVTACLGVDKLLFINQVHGDRILVVRDRYGKMGGGREHASGDAMITDVPGIGLAIQVADCQAVVLYDPERCVVANIHSGWRGSTINIIGRTVETMTAEFGCDPVSLLAGVSPSLGPCCAEFVKYRQEIPEKYWPHKVTENHFDFWAISRDQMVKAGIPHANIEIAGCCTRCNPERFFSYRAERVTGRFVVAAGLLGKVRSNE